MERRVMGKSFCNSKFSNYEFVNFESPNPGPSDDQAAYGECADR
jgi:hypothetical protein